MYLIWEQSVIVVIDSSGTSELKHLQAIVSDHIIIYVWYEESRKR